MGSPLVQSIASGLLPPRMTSIDLAAASVDLHSAKHVCCLFEALVWDAVVGWKRTGGESSSQAGSSGPAVKKANTRTCYIKRLFERGGEKGGV